ncbi:hypothetical protein YC2023_010999 [Brassica napus]
MFDFWPGSGSQSQSLVRINVVLVCCSPHSRVWWKWRVYHPLVSPNKSGFGLDVGVLVLSRWLSAVIGVLGFDRLWLVGFAASVRPIVVCCELRVLAGIFALCR